MSAEVAIICDSCGAVMGAATTAAAARVVLLPLMPVARGSDSESLPRVGLPGGKDYCDAICARHAARRP